MSKRSSIFAGAIVAGLTAVVSTTGLALNPQPLPPLIIRPFALNPQHLPPSTRLQNHQTRGRLTHQFPPNPCGRICKR
jgi:hypothetical protein